MNTQPPRKPTIIWILQDNQLSPIIVNFLKLLKNGLGKINLQFLIPEMDTKALEMAKELKPLTFKSARLASDRSRENYMRKRDLIKNGRFPEGLTYWQTLLMDDLGGGLIVETVLDLPYLTNVKGIILQIPTPLGSATKEEFIVNAWLQTAQKNKVFIAGYELLSLYTRWTMIPSMLDGVITTNELSHRYLTNPAQKLPGKIWKLPLNEGKVFSPGTGVLWQSGLEAPYHYRIKFKLPLNATILYMAHNVAMSYEFKKIVESLQDMGQRIHLMFSIGKDQVRGTHNHEEIIQTICGKALENFHSYSFHDLNAPWEMTAADAVVAASVCYSASVADAIGIPCIIMDDMVPEVQIGHLTIVGSFEHLKKEITHLLSLRDMTTDFTHIIYEMANGTAEKRQI